jgi:hypothetical protein
MQPHSDLFPEFGCNGELIEMPDRCTDTGTVRYCAVCWTEFRWALANATWVEAVYPGMKAVDGLADVTIVQAQSPHCTGSDNQGAGTDFRQSEWLKRYSTCRQSA